jgi:hypothetical protein
MKQGWVGLVMVIAACTLPSRTRLPSQGGDPWIEVETEHFTVWTDATPKRARELVREFERRRRIVARAMDRAPAKERAFVIALRSEWEASAYLPENIAGMAVPDSASLRPAIVLHADHDDRDRTVSHELTHVISHSIVKKQPAWFAEGIATYFEMVDLDSDTRSVVVGVPRQDRLRVVRDRRTLALREVLACSDLRCHDAEFYGSAWALFSFLVNRRFEQLNQYLAQLNAGVDPTEAFTAAFGPLDALDAELRLWEVNGDFLVPHIAVEAASYPSTERALGDGDVLAARGLMLWETKRDGKAAEAATSAALAADPTNVLGRLMARKLELGTSAEAARATARAHPDDWRAWFVLGMASTDNADTHEAYAQICKLAPGLIDDCGS